MKLAKLITITLKNNMIFRYRDVTQMYTVGNFLTITGETIKKAEELDITRIATDRHTIEELKNMIVIFY